MKPPPFAGVEAICNRRCVPLHDGIAVALVAETSALSARQFQGHPFHSALRKQ
jgi:hypothetical protein